MIRMVLAIVAGVLVALLLIGGCYLVWESVGWALTFIAGMIIAVTSAAVGLLTSYAILAGDL